MKKIFLLAAMIVLSSSCSNDEKAPENETATIIGKWQLTDILESGKPISGYSCNKEYDTNQFLANDRSVVSYSDKNASNVCVQFFEEQTYTIVDNVLTETQKNGSIKIYEAKYKIKELKNSSLKLERISLFEANSNGSNPMTTNYATDEEVKVYKKI